MKIFIILIIFLTNFSSYAFIIPKNNEADFDIIRKNKIIGNINTIFNQIGDELIVETTVNIQLKILFLEAYKFYQKTKEVWKKDQLIEVDGYTDFEDAREYYIKGKYTNDQFEASGMDGKLILNKEILTLNYLNKKILKEKKVFDTQKGIVRDIKVKKLKDEKITINNIQINTEKYTLKASTNAKDKNPFPVYTLWYAKNGELLKFIFINPKDKKKVITQRNNWGDN